MQKTILTATLILAGLAAIPDARADRTVWKSTAMACVPTSATVEAGNYVTTAGRVKHDDGALGRISFICPFDEARELSLRKSYRLQASIKRVSNHPLPREYVTVQLRAADERSGHVFTILETEFDNFLATPGEPLVRIWSQDEVIGWNDDFTYWVQLTIDRDRVREAVGVEQIPSILSVRLIQD